MIIDAQIVKPKAWEKCVRLAFHIYKFLWHMKRKLWGSFKSHHLWMWTGKVKARFGPPPLFWLSKKQLIDAWRYSKTLHIYRK
jgi:hypothetical protein